MSQAYRVAPLSQYPTPIRCDRITPWWFYATMFAAMAACSNADGAGAERGIGAEPGIDRAPERPGESEAIPGTGEPSDGSNSSDVDAGHGETPATGGSTLDAGGGEPEAAVPERILLDTAVELSRSTITRTSYSARGVAERAGQYAGAMGGHSLTYRGFQYVTYYEADGSVMVARRDLGQGKTAWQKSRLAGYRVTTDDRHNKMASAVSRGDGTIHLAFDHHTSPAFHYASTAGGVADRPGEIAWTDQVFTYHENLRQPSWFAGTFPERTVTYPTFLEIGDDLMLYWRSGGTAQGRMNLAKYDTEAHAWKTRMTFTSEKGTYREGSWSSDSRGPYHAGFVLDPMGNLHVSWLWRERNCTQPNVRYCNHGLYYAWSSDLGTTWRDTNGKVVGGTNKPITVEGIEPAWQIGVELDPSNTAIQSRWAAELNAYEVYLDHEEGNGAQARKTYRYTLSAEKKWSKQQVDKTPGGVGVQIPSGGPGSVPNQTWDYARLGTEGIASVVYQDEPKTPGAATPLYVIDYRFAQ